MSMLGDTNIITTIMNIVYFGVFFVFMFFSQKIQTLLMMRQVSKALTKLRGMRDKAKEAAISAITTIGKPARDPKPRLERLLQFFTIEPQSMDPAGIIQRLEHMLDTAESRIKDEVQNLENLVEAAQTLNTIYRVVRHYYLLGKKDGTLYTTMQIQMQLPTIMEEAESYTSFLDAFKEGKPVGDGIGALTASKLMTDRDKFEPAKEMVAAETTIEGRRALVTKAKGPGGTVGKTGDAVSNLITSNDGKVSLIVMIDAGLKLEGEESGEVAEGVGAAIGGFGVDKYKIEEAATKHQIPVYAIVVKESLKDVLASMTEPISRSVEDVTSRLRRVITERTKEGDLVIIVGVGNTMGIGQ
jgi:hypothetical protein